MAHFCGLTFARVLREKKFDDKIYGFFAQVTAGYTWWNLLESLCPPTKTVLRINLDETAVKIWMPPGKGLIARSSLDVVRGPRCISPATRKQQRACLTHVAFVCDNPSIQVHLPHVIIGNEAVLPLYIQRELEPQLFSNVYLVRRKSAWVDAGYMVVIIKLLGELLKPFLGTAQPILLMDALPAHIAPKVFRAATRCGIWVVIVPAKLTWLIQPADTHAFYKYKMFLKKRYVEARARSAEGELELREVLKAINDGVRYVFQAHDWSKAFDENGFGHQQRLLRTSVAVNAGLTMPVVIRPNIPSLAQMRSIWPSNSDVPLDDVFAPFLTSADDIANSDAVQRAARREAPHAAQPLSQDEPWAERLRPRRSGSFVFPPAYEVAGDSSARNTGAAGPTAWPMREAAPPPAPARAARAPRQVARPIAASRRSAPPSVPLRRETTAS